MLSEQLIIYMAPGPGPIGDFIGNVIGVCGKILIFGVLGTYSSYLGSGWEIMGPREQQTYSGGKMDPSAPRGSSQMSIIAEKHILLSQIGTHRDP